MTEEANPVKPCLGCGMTEPQAQWCGEEDRGEYWWVRCPHCLMQGPQSTYKGGAIQRWNKLAPVESLPSAPLAPRTGLLYWPTAPSQPCPTCGHKAELSEQSRGETPASAEDVQVSE